MQAVEPHRFNPTFKLHFSSHYHLFIYFKYHNTTTKIVQIMYSMFQDQDLFRLQKQISKSHVVITPLYFYMKI